MPNPIFIQKAKKWMNKDVPVERTRQNPKQKNPLSASNVSYSFLEGTEGERILKEYKARVSGHYQNASVLNNLSFLPKPEDNWEDLALVLYDKSQEGENPREAQALYESLKNHRQALGLSLSDLENRLIIVNPGIEKDNGSNYGVKPIVLLGLTQVYTHEVLSKVGEDPNFDGYGLSGGLPLLKQLGKGDRTLYMPDEKSDIGLRVLFRSWNLGLFAGFRVLADDDDTGRVNFAPQARAP